MGRSVDLYSFDLEKLKGRLIDYCNITTDEDNQKLEDILRTFGNVIGDKYVILNNEFWEDYSCYYNVSAVIDKVFKVDDSFGEIFCNYKNEIVNRQELVSAMECCESEHWRDEFDED